jgi:hypothetical protein
MSEHKLDENQQNQSNDVPEEEKNPHTKSAIKSNQ